MAIREQLLPNYERLLGLEHPETVRARANLALSYQSAGRTADAIAIGEQVVADRERLLGPEHPDTLRALANLALFLWSAGRPAEAIAIDEQVVADYERLLGPEHPDTLRARANLALSSGQPGARPRPWPFGSVSWPTMSASLAPSTQTPWRRWETSRSCGIPA